MDSISGPSSSDNKKSLWKKPEGFGLILIGLLLAGFLLYSGNNVLATIQSSLIFIFSSIWYMAGAAASLLFLGWLASNKELHCLVWNVYKMCMRGLAGIVIEQNPIAILKNSIQDMRHHKEKLDENRDELEGAKTKLDKKIEANEKEVAHLMKTAEAAKSRLNAATTEMDKLEWNKQLQLSTIKAGGLKDMNMKLYPIETNMSKMCEFLKKASWAADFTISKAEIDVELREAEWTAVQSSSKALRSAMSAMNGNPDQRALLEQTIEYMETDMSKKVGEMKRIMEVSSTFINAADLDSDASFSEGMKMLDSFMAGNDITLITDAEAQNLGSTKGTLGQAFMPQATLGQAAQTSVGAYTTKPSKW